METYYRQELARLYVARQTCKAFPDAYNYYTWLIAEARRGLAQCAQWA